MLDIYCNLIKGVASPHFAIFYWLEVSYTSHLKSKRVDYSEHNHKGGDHAGHIGILPITLNVLFYIEQYI